MAVFQLALSTLCVLAAAAEVLPGVLEHVLLVPSKPYHIKVPIGEAKFLGFTCMGGPADVVISLSTYAERADPLLFLSLNPDKVPSFTDHDASSFGQWREDASGDHYVVAKGVNPNGGILGLVNMRHFAGEELDGVLSIHCTFIVAFDTLFWDHLRSSSVCPVGRHVEDGRVVQAGNFCSGHGMCGKHGLCDCDGDFTGPACEHSKIDHVVAADGHYRFQVATDRYQYFRVRIPPRFQGGYLQVKVMSTQPLVVLVRGDDLPTKSNFELSNFDDWVNKRDMSTLKFAVPAAQGVSQGAQGGYGEVPMSAPPGPGGPGPATLPGIPGLLPPPLPATGRRLIETLQEAGNLTSWSDFFQRAKDDEDGFLTHQLQRKLQADDRCSALPPKPSSPACWSPAFKDCEKSCTRCMSCVKGGHGGAADMGCTQACHACVAPTCINTLAQCAENTSCMDSAAMKCDAGCSSCMACFDSNDEQCSECGCCISCLPLAAKCSINQQSAAEYNTFAFVGVYNHRRYYKDRGVVAAAADISLKTDPDFRREDVPSNWIADLYDQFHDIRSLEVTQGEVYPDGQQFIYNLDLDPSRQVMSLELKLYRDRLTLLHIGSVAGVARLVLEFGKGPTLSHMLSSSNAAPKTFFDFDQLHEKAGDKVDIKLQDGSQALWCAMFGDQDGFVHLSLAAVEAAPQGPAIGFALVCVFGLVCAMLVLGAIYGGAQKMGEFLGMDPSMPLMERLGCLVRNQNPHESTVSLTRQGSLTGYIGSDVIDRSVEDQYLHRGGSGDDGI